MSIAVASSDRDLSTAQRLIVLGAKINPTAFAMWMLGCTDGSVNRMRLELEAWTNEELTRHEEFVSTFLMGVDTTPGPTRGGKVSHLTKLSGIPDLKVAIADWLSSETNLRFHTQ